MRHLPVLQPRPHFDLDALEVETPCAVPWDSMQGDNRVRYCGHCRQNVYNIEALPRAEAVRLVSVREGRPCIRFYRRRDGTVVTADCWARLRAARRRGLLAFTAMLIAVGAIQLAAMVTGLANLGRTTGSPPPGPDAHEVRGKSRNMGLYAAPARQEVPVVPEKANVAVGQVVLLGKRAAPTPVTPEPRLLGRMRRQ